MASHHFGGIMKARNLPSRPVGAESSTPGSLRQSPIGCSPPNILEIISLWHPGTSQPLVNLPPAGGGGHSLRHCGSSSNFETDGFVPDLDIININYATYEQK